MVDTTHGQMTFDSYFDKIFYINLTRDTDRNEHMLREFEKCGIKNFERVEAIALIELPGPDAYRNFIKKDHKYIVGGLSCRVSHLKCIQLAKERNYTKVLILEDDVSFPGNPNWLLEKNQATLHEWDMLYFSGLVEPFFRNQVVGAYAYAVKNTVYADIINMADASGMEIDNFYAKILQHMSYNYNRSGKYDVKAILPFNFIAHNNIFNSNIQNK